MRRDFGRKVLTSSGASVAESEALLSEVVSSTSMLLLNVRYFLCVGVSLI